MERRCCRGGIYAKARCFLGHTSSSSSFFSGVGGWRGDTVKLLAFPASQGPFRPLHKLYLLFVIHGSWHCFRQEMENDRLGTAMAMARRSLPMVSARQKE